ncbi:hypothetical protein QR680_004495 [Steinernema hermaphroditum]|uniref:G-protein coupled receptors family 3 profile domain-containing protein n=1 Tax=Steinernema hermaphroditum TaxID=289476 RepID=A0AA39HQB4_9BILA|nr:hypothetical protein QR680_004495 [Steinernema hermaphroditum]
MVRVVARRSQLLISLVVSILVVIRHLGIAAGSVKSSPLHCRNDEDAVQLPIRKATHFQCQAASNSWLTSTAISSLLYAAFILQACNVVVALTRCAKPKCRISLEVSAIVCNILIAIVQFVGTNEYVTDAWKITTVISIGLCLYLPFAFCIRVRKNEKDYLKMLDLSCITPKDTIPMFDHNLSRAATLNRTAHSCVTMQAMQSDSDYKNVTEISFLSETTDSEERANLLDETFPELRADLRTFLESTESTQANTPDRASYSSSSDRPEAIC